MNESKTRDKILKRIRQALIDKSSDPFPDISFASGMEEYDDQEFPELLFAENFIAAGGHFTFCENEAELKAFLQHVVQQLNAGKVICTHPKLKKFSEEINPSPSTSSGIPVVSISSSFSLVAYPPSMILSDSSCFHSAINYIVVATAQETVHELKQGLQRIKEAVRIGSENHFEIISFAETGNDEISGFLPASNFFIAMIDWKI